MIVLYIDRVVYQASVLYINTACTICRVNTPPTLHVSSHDVRLSSESSRATSDGENARVRPRSWASKLGMLPGDGASSPSQATPERADDDMGEHGAPTPSGPSAKRQRTPGTGKASRASNSSRLSALSNAARDFLSPGSHRVSSCRLCCRSGAAAFASHAGRVWRGHAVRRLLLRAGPDDGAPRALVSSQLWERMQPHQRRGLGFLFERHHRGGAILADEPGLGKTLQALALVDKLVQGGLPGCVLIVAPAEMLATWAREFKRFLPPGAIDATVISKDASRLAAADHLRFPFSVIPSASLSDVYTRLRPFPFPEKAHSA